MTSTHVKRPVRHLRRAITGLLASSAVLLGSAVLGAHPDHGKILFSATQQDVAVEGEFRKFSADIEFNPTKPNAGKVTLVIDLASVITGSSEADDLLKDKVFFDAKHFPQATFNSKSIDKSAAGQFQARGDFSLKGRSMELVIPFTARSEGSGLRIEGHLPISRLAYKVGEGEWADTGTLADQVLIMFSLHIP